MERVFPSESDDFVQPNCYCLAQFPRFHLETVLLGPTHKQTYTNVRTLITKQSIFQSYIHLNLSLTHDNIFDKYDFYKLASTCILTLQDLPIYHNKTTSNMRHLVLGPQLPPTMDSHMNSIYAKLGVISFSVTCNNIAN